MIRASRFYTKMFRHFGVELRDLSLTRFTSADPDAVTEQVCQWLGEQKDKRYVGLDSERVDPVAWAIAHDFDSGQSMEQVIAKFEPLVSKQCEPNQVSTRMAQLITQARRLVP